MSPSFSCLPTLCVQVRRNQWVAGRMSSCPRSGSYRHLPRTSGWGHLQSFKAQVFSIILILSGMIGLSQVMKKDLRACGIVSNGGSHLGYKLLGKKKYILKSYLSFLEQRTLLSGLSTKDCYSYPD